MCSIGACVGATAEEKGKRAEREEKREMEGELHCHETWISLWTVDAAVAAAVFQIALNSQRLCEMNE